MDSGQEIAGNWQDNAKQVNKVGENYLGGGQCSIFLDSDSFWSRRFLIQCCLATFGSVLLSGSSVSFSKIINRFHVILSSPCETYWLTRMVTQQAKISSFLLQTDIKI